MLRASPTEGDLELVHLPPGLSVSEAITRLHGHPSVRFAERNFIYTADESSNDPYYTSNQLWGMYGDATSPANQYGSQAGEAWAAGFVGIPQTGDVYVAVTDHGVRLDHDDLKMNFWTNLLETAGDGIDNDGNGYIDDINGWDFSNNDKTVFDSGTQDSTDGHGTHVAGTIGARGGNAAGVAGVSWNVKLIVTKYLNDNGGTSANIPRVLDYLIALKTRKERPVNIVATNNSFGGSGFSQAVLEAIGRANTANILFVASAGNNNRSNDSSPYYPSSYDQPNVISVAAIEKDGAKRSSSSWGASSVDLGAPGGDILSTLGSSTSAYGSKGGTSMAAPHVTGAIALYAALNPGASAAQIKSAILNNSAPTASLAGRVVTGGRLDVAKALGASNPSPTSTPTAGPSSTPTLTPTAGPSSTPTSTATITATPSADNHVGDLNGSSTQRNKRQWSAEVKITVHNASHAAAPNVTVSGTYTWTGGSRSGTCTTGSSGSCLINSQALPTNTTSASFTVTHLSPNYVPSENHDADGDSDGTTLEIPR